MKELTQEKLKEQLHYNRDTGIFTWIINRHRIEKGFVAGCICPVIGYIRIGLFGNQYKAHRLVFLYMEGSFPEGQVDHLNHVRTDNRWCNLRKITDAENKKNISMRSDNKSGFTGVSWDKKRRKWVAQMQVDNKMIMLGRFDTHYTACYARHFANIKHGFHKNHGVSL